MNSGTFDVQQEIETLNNAIHEVNKAIARLCVEGVETLVDVKEQEHIPTLRKLSVKCFRTTYLF